VAIWTFSVDTWTPTAVANTNAFTDGGYMGLMGGSTTQMLKITNIISRGQATSSAPNHMVLARDSTVQATPTALAAGQSMAPGHTATAALAAPPVAFTASSTKPQRSASTSFPRINLSFNAFGGQAYWDAPVGGEFWVLGNTASLGEASFSHLTTGTPGLQGTTITFEPL